MTLQVNIGYICRTNLCIPTDPGYRHFADLHAKHNVTLIASLPAFMARKCDKVRGAGMLDVDLEARRRGRIDFPGSDDAAAKRKDALAQSDLQSKKQPHTGTVWRIMNRSTPTKGLFHVVCMPPEV